MQSIKVGNRFGVTTDTILISNGLCVVWFENAEIPEYINYKEIEYIQSTLKSTNDIWRLHKTKKL
jgi:hypothetical protein